MEPNEYSYLIARAGSRFCVAEIFAPLGRRVVSQRRAETPQLIKTPFIDDMRQAVAQGVDAGAARRVRPLFPRDRMRGHRGCRRDQRDPPACRVQIRRAARLS